MAVESAELAFCSPAFTCAAWLIRVPSGTRAGVNPGTAEAPLLTPGQLDQTAKVHVLKRFYSDECTFLQMINPVLCKSLQNCNFFFF